MNFGDDNIKIYRYYAIDGRYYVRADDNYDDDDYDDEVDEKINSERPRTNVPIGPGKCPLCGGNTRLLTGKFGKFYGCKNYPTCRGLRGYDGELHPQKKTTQPSNVEIISELDDVINSITNKKHKSILDKIKFTIDILPVTKDGVMVIPNYHYVYYNGIRYNDYRYVEKEGWVISVRKSENTDEWINIKVSECSYENEKTKNVRKIDI